LKNIARFLCLPALLAVSHLASAGVITEEYTGSQDVNEGDSFSFDFDLWLPNIFVGDSAPGMHLTTDGVGATGAWSAANLYLGFSSTDSDPEIAAIDLDGWTFRFLGLIPGGSQNVMFDTLSFNAGGSGPGSILANYYLTAAQTDALSNYGGGTLRLTATNNNRSYDNDFTITKVGLQVITAIKVVEPSTLALFAAGLLGVVLLANRRRLTPNGALPA
jgi:hypothetical protein